MELLSQPAQMAQGQQQGQQQQRAAAPAAAAAAAKPKTPRAPRGSGVLKQLRLLKSNYFDDLSFLLAEFTKLEVQLALGDPSGEAAAPDQQVKMARLQYFVEHVKTTMDRIEQALRGEQKYDMRQVKLLDHHIRERLLPVKERLLQQIELAEATASGAPVAAEPEPQQQRTLSWEDMGSEVSSSTAGGGANSATTADSVSMTSTTEGGEDERDSDLLELEEHHQKQLLLQQQQQHSQAPPPARHPLRYEEDDMDEEQVDDDEAIADLFAPMEFLHDMDHDRDRAGSSCSVRSSDMAPLPLVGDGSCSSGTKMDVCTLGAQPAPPQDAAASPAIAVGCVRSRSRSRKRQRNLLPALSQPRDVKYECSACKESYITQIECNPWWALFQQTCPDCGTKQVPRVNISLPVNNVDYHLQILRACAEADAEGEDPFCSDSGSDTEDEEEIPADPEEGGAGAELHKLQMEPERSAKLLVLMCHARACSGVHRNPRHAEVCRSTKFLMLHVRDCGGILDDGSLCPHRWCAPCKMLLYHLVHCTNPDTCATCNPVHLPPQLQELRNLTKLEGLALKLTPQENPSSSSSSQAQAAPSSSPPVAAAYPSAVPRTGNPAAGGTPALYATPGAPALASAQGFQEPPQVQARPVACPAPASAGW
jgi:transcription elongation factor Elf1